MVGLSLRDYTTWAAACQRELMGPHNRGLSVGPEGLSLWVKVIATRASPAICQG